MCGEHVKIVQNIFLPNAAMVAAETIDAFADRGLEVITTFTRSSLDQRAALASGDADVAVTALDNLFAWNQNGDHRFRAVAQIERATSLPVHVRAGLGSLPDLADLDRVRVVVDSPASGFGIALVAIVIGLGIGSERLEIVAAGGVNERLAAMRDGLGDVALLAPFVAAEAQEAGLARVSALEQIYRDYPGLVVVALEPRLGEAADTLVAYLAALAEARAWLANHPDAAVASLSATGLSAEAARAQLELCGHGPLTVSRQGFDLLRVLRDQQGLLADVANDFDDFVTHRYLQLQED
jgi:ABC-type nitrate/sulfonate/bicarbonate transport system substrate-binding protein